VFTFRFGTDGVRGIIDLEFTEDLVAVLTESTLRYWSRRYGVRSLLVGFDSRKKSRLFAETAAAVARGFGVDVVMVREPTPTPVVAWYTKTHGYDLAIQITASHNPPMYNGFKLITAKGSPAQDEDTDGIEGVFRDEREDIIRSALSRGRISVDLVDPRPEYIEYVCSSVDGMFRLRRRFKIIVDPIHATSIGYTSEILRKLGMDVEEIHNYYDPEFGGREPNPEARNIPEIIDSVTRGMFDMGIAHDGDADRVGLVDIKHGYLSANDIIPIMAHSLAQISRIGKGIARTVSTTHLVDRVASRFGLKVIEVPVGVKYVARAIMSSEVDMGGEESGGLVFSWHIPDKDGIYTASLMVGMASESGSLTNLVDEVREIYGYTYFSRVDVEMRGSKEFVRRNRDAIVRGLGVLGKVVRVVDIDGVKVIYDDSWVLIRGSGTEPKLRIYAESQSRERTNELIAGAKGLIDSLRG